MSTNSTKGDDVRDDSLYETVWTCDICKVASFASYEEAVKHENKCGAKGSAKRKDFFPTGDDDDVKFMGSSRSDPPTPASVKSTEVWTCDVCKVAEFSSYDEAVEHEKRCNGAPPSQKKPNSQPGSVVAAKVQPSPAPSFQRTLWACDICFAEYPTFEEAVEHEKLCKVRKDANEVKKKGATERPGPHTKVSSSVCQVCPPANENDQLVETTVWTCDVCKKAEFRTFKEAEMHEKTCKGNFSSESSAPARSAVTTPPKVVLSPLVRGEMDAPRYSHLSQYDRLLVGSLDLYENRQGAVRLVGFRCHYCQFEMTGYWNMQTFNESLPGALHKHLINACKKIPLDILNQLTRARARMDHECQITLLEFASSFFYENGVAEMTTDLGEKQLVILDIRQCQQQLARGCRRRQWMASMDDPNSKKSPSLIETLQAGPPSAKAQIFYQGVIPVLHELLRPHWSQLSPFNQLALQQIHLAPQIRNLSPGGLCALDPMCKHCGAISKVNSLDTIYKGFYSITYSHLLKSCPHVPNPMRSMLLTYQKSKKSGANSGGTLGLRAYCEHLVRVLELVDIKSNGVNLPGFGIKIKSDEIPGIIQKEQPDRSIATKRKPAIAAAPNSEKRQRTDQPQARTPTVKNISQPLVYVSDDGVKVNLPPAGGVPLLSSLSVDKSSKLSVYDRLILDELELFTFQTSTLGNGGTNGSRSQSLLGIRCQNCKSDPVLGPAGSSKSLSSVEGWFKLVAEMGKGHLPRCSCLSLQHQQIIIKEQNDASRKSQANVISLEVYCDWLTNLYGMENAKGNGITGVVWGQCMSIEPGYAGPDPLRMKPTVNTKPHHNLMLPGSSLPVQHKQSEAKPTHHMVLSDYGYLSIAQLDFVPIQRKTPLLPTDIRRTTRRIRENGSPPSSGRSSPTRPDPESSLGEELGLRCKHCHLIRPISSISLMSTNMLYQYQLHFKKCAKFPKQILTQLDELKAIQPIQKTPAIVTVPEYARKIAEVYKMEDKEWNGVSRGVVFGEGTIATFGTKSSNSDASNFIVPLLQKDQVQPVTLSLAFSIGATSQ